ncbi:MAG: 6-phosphofructokinase [Clostridia bacterium]|nr:6-phosphofructokinase [Clostridia bacterium]
MNSYTEKRIGVLTSGGDAPGMNAAIRAVVRAGIYYGYEVFGIENGYSGLLAGNISPMTLRSVSEIINRGGTILKTSRCPEFETEAGIKKGAEMARLFKLDAVIVIGGDGSFRGARDLSKEGIPVIGIPGTIDNDVSCTDYTIGYDTALNTVKDAIDKIKDTAYSHERCSIIEVMGRDAGYIALNCAIAGGAEACLLPEKPLNIDEDVIKQIIGHRNRGKEHFIIVVAEGVGRTNEIAARIEETLGITPTVSVLGYIQRGGNPTVRDRVNASLMGVKAVELIKNDDANRIVASRAGQIVGLPIDEALAMKKTISEYEILASNILAL